MRGLERADHTGAGRFLLTASTGVQFAGMAGCVRGGPIAVTSAGVAQVGAFQVGGYMTGAIGIDIAVPLDGLAQAAVAAALGIPYFRWFPRVQQTFVDA